MKLLPRQIFQLLCLAAKSTRLDAATPSIGINKPDQWPLCPATLPEQLAGAGPPLKNGFSARSRIRAVSNEKLHWADVEVKLDKQPPMVCHQCVEGLGDTRAQHRLEPCWLPLGRQQCGNLCSAESFAVCILPPAV